MSFSVMKTKISKKNYKTIEEFDKDVEWVGYNCQLYNGDGTYFYVYFFFKCNYFFSFYFLIKFF
jgi:hypothetical protein